MVRFSFLFISSCEYPQRGLAVWVGESPLRFREQAKAGKQVDFQESPTTSEKNRDDSCVCMILCPSGDRGGMVVWCRIRDLSAILTLIGHAAWQQTQSMYVFISACVASLFLTSSPPSSSSSLARHKHTRTHICSIARGYVLGE